MNSLGKFYTFIEKKFFSSINSLLINEWYNERKS